MAPRPLSRRAFLRSALGAGVAAAVGGAALIARRIAIAAPTPSPLSPHARGGERGGVARYALIIDTTRCVGCGACVKACNIRNNLPGGKSTFASFPEAVSWIAGFYLYNASIAPILPVPTFAPPVPPTVGVTAWC